MAVKQTQVAIRCLTLQNIYAKWLSGHTNDYCEEW